MYSLLLYTVNNKYLFNLIKMNIKELSREQKKNSQVRKDANTG
jgi:hypothetical protein